MRLERLELVGFGRLGDICLDLAPRVTVLLGENEAGKTTILRAIRAALYGIDAGGQGRAVAASDWARWAPWAGQRYGLTLTYSAADGRRFRVARRLDQREQTVQVQEIGGPDRTDAMRLGRLVVPGQVHLGVDEAVFCATACLGEESLRPDSPDGATERAVRLQEAIERLADTAATRSTAAEALGRLRHAMERLGTENRVRSPLGAATSRLRQLESELARARQRTDALGAEQERLVELERRAAEAEHRSLEAERAWLLGRIGALRTQRRELAAALDESHRLEAVAAEWQRFAIFPVEREERVIALGGQLRQAVEAGVQMTGRWDVARERLAAIERRRLEIATSIGALGRVPRIDAGDLDEWRRLSEEVAGEAAVERRADALRAAEARVAAVRKEIAATGLGSVPVGGADAVAELVDATLGAGAPRRRLRSIASVVVALGAALGGGAWFAGVHPVAPMVMTACLLAAAGLLAAERLGGGPGQEARRQLSRRCPGLDLSEQGLLRAAERLPDVRRLHADLQRQEMLAEAGRAELEEAAARVTDLAERCRGLAARLPVEVPDIPGAAGDPGGCRTQLERARAALHSVEEAAAAGRRRAELEDEDIHLQREEGGCRAIGEDAVRAAATRTRIAEELARELDGAGLPAEADPVRAVAAFRQACASRRQLDAANDQLVQVRRRIAALAAPDEAALARQEVALEAELHRRGAAPPPADAGLPGLDSAALSALETTAEYARRTAMAASTEATALRERLGGALDGTPAVADLEDERQACLAVRDAALRQLEALRCAGALIEDAARRVHRDVAPKLAASVGRRLALLTEGRYEEVNVDAERFAVSLRPPERPDLVAIELLSHGTRDQVSLLLRLALVEVFGEAGEPVPLLLDDPLLSADPARRRLAVTFLERLSETTQVVLSTSEPAVAEQVAAEGGDGCAVIRLEPPATLGRPVRMAAGGGDAVRAAS